MRNFTEDDVMGIRLRKQLRENCLKCENDDRITNSLIYVAVVAAAVYFLSLLCIFVMKCHVFFSGLK